jgi:predicted DNA-binding transcriptional regulator YafY
MRADRLLSILLILQSRHRVTARELAERLEVSERTILRDMDALSSSGIPVVAERGKGGGWALLGDYQTKLTGLNPAEIQSLFLARPARLIGDLGLKRESEAALIKLQAAMPPEVREKADLAGRRILIDSRGWRDPSESILYLPVLLDAIWRGKKVRFLYGSDFCEATERIGDPLGLVAKGSTWYLVANLEGQTRTYRVSRIREAAALEVTAAVPDDFNLALYWERATEDFRAKLPRYYARFLAKASVMRWVRYRGWRLEEEIPDGDRIRIKLRFDVEGEAIQFALSFGGEIEVMEPVDLRDKVLAGARAILDNLARSDSPDRQ